MNANNDLNQRHILRRRKRRLIRFLASLLVIAAIIGICFYLKNYRENLNRLPDTMELCANLVADLKKDTLNLQKFITSEAALVEKDDSLTYLLQDAPDKMDTRKIKQLITASYTRKFFYPASKAINSVQNQLHDKQFDSTKIAAYIADYEGSLDTLKALQDLQAHDLNSDLKSFSKTNFGIDKTTLLTDSLFNDDEPADTSEDVFSRFSIKVSLMQSFNNDLISNSKKAKLKAVKLIKYIKQTFHL